MGLFRELEQTVDTALATPNPPPLTFEAEEMAALLEVVRAALAVAVHACEFNDERLTIEVTGWNGVMLVDMGAMDRLATSLRTLGLGGEG